MLVFHAPRVSGTSNHSRCECRFCDTVPSRTMLPQTLGEIQGFASRGWKLRNLNYGECLCWFDDTRAATVRWLVLCSVFARIFGIFDRLLQHPKLIPSLVYGWQRFS